MQKTHGHSLHDYVVRELGQQIVSGKLPIGKPMPDYSTLRAMLHVSRTTLREALVALAGKGLIEARQKIGTVVRPRGEWNMLDTDVLTWGVESNTAEHLIAELYELRELIEPLAASLAAERATQADIERLRSAYKDMVAAGDDISKVMEPDVRFHRGIIAATGNSPFASLGHVIATALQVNFKTVEDSHLGHTWALPLHEAVLDAIAAHDSKAARAAMQKLLSDAEREDLRFVRPNKASRRPAERVPRRKSRRSLSI